MLNTDFLTNVVSSKFQAMSKLYSRLLLSRRKSVNLERNWLLKRKIITRVRVKCMLRYVLQTLKFAAICFILKPEHSIIFSFCWSFV